MKTGKMTTTGSFGGVILDYLFSLCQWPVQVPISWINIGNLYFPRNTPFHQDIKIFSTNVCQVCTYDWKLPTLFVILSPCFLILYAFCFVSKKERIDYVFFYLVTKNASHIYLSTILFLIWILFQYGLLYYLYILVSSSGRFYNFLLKDFIHTS